MDYIQIGSVIAVIIVAIVAIIFIVKQPKKVKEWLLYAVTLAEADLGGGTGKLKLRQVYDMFVMRFKVISFLVSFETFSNWVDAALTEMRKMLETNDNVKALVEK